MSRFSGGLEVLEYGEKHWKINMLFKKTMGNHGNITMLLQN